MFPGVDLLENVVLNWINLFFLVAAGYDAVWGLLITFTYQYWEAVCFPPCSFLLGYSNDPVRTPHDMYLQVVGTGFKKNTEYSLMCKVTVLQESG